MQNDVLKNKIAPWQEKGRWYHLRFNIDGEDGIYIDHDNSDPIFHDSEMIYTGIEIVISNIDQVVDMRYIVTSTSTPVYDESFLIYSNGYNFQNKRFNLVIHSDGVSTGYVDLYLYIV